MVGRLLVVQATGKQRVLDEGSILWRMDTREPLGRVRSSILPFNIHELNALPLSSLLVARPITDEPAWLLLKDKLILTIFLV